MDNSVMFGAGNPLAFGGKTVHTDFDAPKVIESRELLFFSAKFYLFSEYDSRIGGSYWFEVKADESGKLLLTEKYSFRDLSCEVSAEIFEELQKIIEKYDLVKMNGIEEYTNGLVAEFQPSFLSADYVSGENLYFCTNNDPHAYWSRDVLNLFGKEFAKNGDRRFLPPPETRELTRFNLEFIDGDIHYSYGEMSMMKEGVHYSLEELAEGRTKEEDFFTVINKSPYNRKEDREEGYLFMYNIPSAEYYEGLQALIEKIDMKRRIVDSWGSGSDRPTLYKIYAEYKYGNRLTISSTDEEDYKKSMPLIKELADYIDAFIAKNPHKITR